MPRWAMIIDLEKCVGCGTCVVVCEKFNNTPPTVKWRKLATQQILYKTNMQNFFVTMCCNHCSNPPCLQVCPSKATYQRDDGIVDIDYELCIGCGACITACPYDARAIGKQDRFIIDDDGNSVPSQKKDRIGICTKCNFCRQRLDQGINHGLVPGHDFDATPACVNYCIADALYFGDISSSESEVAKLVSNRASFRLQETLGTDSAVYYLVDTSKIERNK